MEYSDSRKLTLQIKQAYDKIRPKTCTTWPDYAGHTVYWLEERGFSKDQAYRFVVSELGIVPISGSEPERQLYEAAAGLLALVKRADCASLEALVNNTAVKTEKLDMNPASHRRVMHLSSVPDNEFYKLESAGVEGHDAYRADPFASAHTLEHIGTDRD